VKVHAGPILAQRDGCQVVDCAACGWAHLHPLPDPAELHAYYRSAFWGETKAGWRELYEAQRDWLLMSNADWLEAVEPHVPASKIPCLLDVGCGYGYLLRAALARNWHAYGIEPDGAAVVYARQQLYVPLDRHGGVYHGTWENFHSWHLPDRQPNVIAALWLMEHLPDPREFLQWCRDRLAPGGALLLAVPQEFTQPQALANHYADVRDYFVAPSHVNYWTAATFANLLGRAGLRIVDLLATHIMENFIITGDDYTNRPELGARLHADVRRRELEMTREQRLAAARRRARTAQGRDLMVVAKADE
jgi:SAM-dependent methyltransferase